MLPNDNQTEKVPATQETEIEPGSQNDVKPTWQISEEKRAVRKIDMTVLPLLFLGLLAFQLDRMNLASALTAGYRETLAIDQSTVNLGNQMMFLGTVVLEIPFNLILQRLGPRKWIASQVFIFGIVATLQVLVRNRSGYLVIRSLLGLAEAGYIPGSIYTLSTWYRKHELGTRLAFFFFGMFGGNALSPILASGILQMDGLRGLAGWQWLFLLEGLLTMIVGILLLLALPGSPEIPRPLLTKGVVVFSKQDQHILRQRLYEDDLDRHAGSKSLAIPWKLVRQTVLHYKRWPSLLSTFCVFSTWSPLTTYTPSIYVDLGFNRTAANALATVGATLACVVVFLFARLSDRTNRRGLCVMTAQLCYLATLIVARQVSPSAGRWGKWGLWTAVNAFAVGYHPIHNTCKSMTVVCFDGTPPNDRLCRVPVELQVYRRAQHRHCYVGHVCH